MAGDGRPKRQRLADTHAADVQQLLHLGGVSITGLAKLLDRLRANPGVVAAPVGEKDLRRVNARAFSELVCRIEVPLLGGRTFEWEFLDPWKTLQLQVNKSMALRSLYVDALRRRPSSMTSPWRLAVGFDEYIPGSATNSPLPKHLRNYRGFGIAPKWYTHGRTRRTDWCGTAAMWCADWQPRVVAI